MGTASMTDADVIAHAAIRTTLAACAQAGVGAAGQARQQPQVDQDLEAVADADDQAAIGDEFL